MSRCGILHRCRRGYKGAWHCGIRAVPECSTRGVATPLQLSSEYEDNIKLHGMWLEWPPDMGSGACGDLATEGRELDRSHAKSDHINGRRGLEGSNTNY